MTPVGVVVTLRRFKTDQDGRNISKGIPMGLHAATCLVRALRAWLEAAELVSGALCGPVPISATWDKCCVPGAAWRPGALLVVDRHAPLSELGYGAVLSVLH
jgi:hypothetical protein